MRIVFCGSGSVATPTLEALHAAGHEVALVVTQPARRAGRGGKMTATPVFETAGRLGLTVRESPNINVAESVAELRRVAPELIVVVDFGQKVGETVREIAPLGAINMHGSLLPALRGAAPVNWALIRGLKVTGVTTFLLVDRMDAGDILLQRELAIEPEETAEELRARLARLGAETVLETLEGLAAGTIQPEVQDESLVTQAPKLSKADGVIDFSQSVLTVANRIHGTWSWPEARADFVHEGRRPVRVLFARVRPVAADQPNAADAGVVAEDLTINMPDGRLEVLELKVAGKRLMTWRDFVNGYRVAPGDRFVTDGGGSQ